MTGVLGETGLRHGDGDRHSGFTPTGTVTYEFFTTPNGTGTPRQHQTVTLSGGMVPNSATDARPWRRAATRTSASTAATATTRLHSGAVEPLTISQGTPSVSTTIFDSRRAR